MKLKKNVTKLEMKNSLLQTLEYNSEALDFIENESHKYEDLLKYDDLDGSIKNIQNILKYIKFSLNYLDDMYNESLKKLGGV